MPQELIDGSSTANGAPDQGAGEDHDPGGQQADGDEVTGVAPAEAPQQLVDEEYAQQLVAEVARATEIVKAAEVIELIDAEYGQLLGPG